MKSLKTTRFSISAFLMIVVLSITTGFLTGCTNNQDNAGASVEKQTLADSKLLGTWKMASFSYESEFSAGEVSGKISAEGVDLDNVLLTFKPDGTTEGSGSFNVNMSTTMGGHTSTKKLEGNSPVNNGTWKQSGNTLTIDSPDNPMPGSQKVTIASLSDNELKIIGDLPSPAGVGNTIKLKVSYTRVK